MSIHSVLGPRLMAYVFERHLDVFDQTLAARVCAQWREINASVGHWKSDALLNHYASMFGSPSAFGAYLVWADAVRGRKSPAFVHRGHLMHALIEGHTGVVAWMRTVCSVHRLDTCVWSHLLDRGHAERVHLDLQTIAAIVERAPQDTIREWLSLGHILERTRTETFSFLIETGLYGNVDSGLWHAIGDAQRVDLAAWLLERTSSVIKDSPLRWVQYALGGALESTRSRHKSGAMIEWIAGTGLLSDDNHEAWIGALKRHDMLDAMPRWAIDQHVRPLAAENGRAPYAALGASTPAVLEWLMKEGLCTIPAGLLEQDDKRFSNKDRVLPGSVDTMRFALDMCRCAPPSIALCREMVRCQRVDLLQEMHHRGLFHRNAYGRIWFSALCEERDAVCAWARDSAREHGLDPPFGVHAFAPAQARDPLALYREGCMSAITIMDSNHAHCARARDLLWLLSHDNVCLSPRLVSVLTDGADGIAHVALERARRGIKAACAYALYPDLFDNHRHNVVNDASVVKIDEWTPSQRFTWSVSQRTCAEAQRVFQRTCVLRALDSCERGQMQQLAQGRLPIANLRGLASLFADRP